MQEEVGARAQDERGHEFEEVDKLLEESINKLQNADVKPSLFGVELEDISAQSMFSLAGVAVYLWVYMETDGALGGG